ncbi:hypothetical protein BDC45DRAFT_517716 [Circinella umbellata]|nr:hypothetical protein BDC45DRAFT_517716 [Circinella umbellata]
MAWRVHMLHPLEYDVWTYTQLGRVPNHNTTVLSSQLEKSFAITKNAWQHLPSSFVQNDFTRIKGFAHRILSGQAAFKTANHYQPRGLSEKCLSRNVRDRMLKASLKDISYHGTPTVDINTIFISENQNGSSKNGKIIHMQKQTQSVLPISVDRNVKPNFTFSETVADQVRKEIFSNISHTNYGYIGTILDGIVRKETVEFVKRYI